MIKVALRRVCEGHSPILFFYDAGELYCYQHVGQHSVSDRCYLEDKTYPAKPPRAGDLDLLREWDAQPPKTPYRLVQRLSRRFP